MVIERMKDAYVQPPKQVARALVFREGNLLLTRHAVDQSLADHWTTRPPDAYSTAIDSKPIATIAIAAPIARAQRSVVRVVKAAENISTIAASIALSLTIGWLEC